MKLNHSSNVFNRLIIIVLVFMFMLNLFNNRSGQSFPHKKISMFFWSSAALCDFNSGLFDIALCILQDNSVSSANSRDLSRLFKVTNAGQDLKQVVIPSTICCLCHDFTSGILWNANFLLNTFISTDKKNFTGNYYTLELVSYFVRYDN